MIKIKRVAALLLASAFLVIPTTNSLAAVPIFCEQRGCVSYASKVSNTPLRACKYSYCGGKVYEYRCNTYGDSHVHGILCDEGHFN